MSLKVLNPVLDMLTLPLIWDIAEILVLYYDPFIRLVLNSILSSDYACWKIPPQLSRI